MEKHYRPRKEGRAGQYISEDMDAKLRAMTEELLQLKRQVQEQEEMLKAKDRKEAELLKQQQQRNGGGDGNDAKRTGKGAGRAASSGRLNMEDIWLDDNGDDHPDTNVNQDER